MRRVGVLERPTAQAGDHVCWRFEDEAAFRADACAFLAEGDRRGERLVYVADAPEDDLRSHLAGLDVDRLEREGRLLLQPVHDLYEPGGTFDAGAQVETYRRLVGEALAEGWAGLRVAAEATALVAREAAHRHFVEYELNVDRFIASAPMAAMCAYHGPTVGERVSDLFGVHPEGHGAGGVDLPLRAHWEADRLCVAGEADVSTGTLFGAIVAAVEASTEPCVVLDLSAVDFVDVHSLTRLDAAAESLRQRGQALVVLDPPHVVRRCCELLQLDALASGTVER